MPTKNVKTAEKLEQQDEKIAELTCPICGHKYAEKVLSVDEKSLKEYTRALLGQLPFKKTFVLGDGLLEFTFENLTSADVLRFERLDRTKIKIEDLADIRLLATLTEVTVLDTATGVSTTLYEADLAKRHRLANDFNAGMAELAAQIDSTCLNLCRQCSTLFIILVNTLTNTLMTKDFYKGVGLL